MSTPILHFNTKSHYILFTYTDTYTGCDLQNTITPMVIGQWSSCNEYPFFAKKTEFVGNLLTVAMDEPINTPQGRARPKPMLYQELIKLLTSPGQWVFDPLSGNRKYC